MSRERTRKIELEKCFQCNGCGYKTCGRCLGSGKYKGPYGFTKCFKCRGKGSVPCVFCEGTGKKEYRGKIFVPER